MVAGVADAADAGNVGAAATADDGVFEVLPEAGFKMQGYFTRLLIMNTVDCAREEGGVVRHGVPQADAAERDGHDCVIEFHCFGLDVEQTIGLAVLDRHLLSALVVCHALDSGLEDGAVEDLGSESGRQTRETLVDGAPFRGQEIDSLVEPVRFVRGDVCDFVRDVFLVAEVVQVALKTTSQRCMFTTFLNIIVGSLIRPSIR